MQDGFYRVKIKSEQEWNNIGELKTEDDVQVLRIIGFDEAMDPAEFDIHWLPINMNVK